MSTERLRRKRPILPPDRSAAVDRAARRMQPDPAAGAPRRRWRDRSAKCGFGRRLSRSVVASLVGASAFVAGARGATPPSVELMQAAAVVLIHDALVVDCWAAGGPSAQARSQVADWETANRVDRVRLRLAELKSDAARAAQLEAATRSVVDQVHSRRLDPCAAALSIVRTGEAQFGGRVPELADAPAAPAAPAATGTVAAGATARPSAAAAPAVAAATLAALEGFAFDTRGGMGYGGFVTIDVYPVVLFRDGSLLTDVTGLAYPAGIDAYRRDHPEDWTHWRRAGGELQLQGRAGWKTIAYPKVHTQWPAGLRLEGTYRRLGGSGTLGIGGTQAVAVWNEYTFTRDGRVVRGGGAGASSEFGNVSTVTGSRARGRSGRYRTEGLRLRIDYDDGTSEAPVLLLDPDNPKSALWLDGVGYSRRGK